MTQVAALRVSFKDGCPAEPYSIFSCRNAYKLTGDCCPHSCKNPQSEKLPRYTSVVGTRQRKILPPSAIIRGFNSPLPQYKNNELDEFPGYYILHGYAKK